jgi:hypothetical protein
MTRMYYEALEKMEHTARTPSGGQVNYDLSFSCCMQLLAVLCFYLVRCFDVDISSL